MNMKTLYLKKLNLFLALTVAETGSFAHNKVSETEYTQHIFTITKKVKDEQEVLQLTLGKYMFSLGRPNN